MAPNKNKAFWPSFWISFLPSLFWLLTLAPELVLCYIFQLQSPLFPLLTLALQILLWYPALQGRMDGIYRRTVGERSNPLRWFAAPRRYWQSLWLRLRLQLLFFLWGILCALPGGSCFLLSALFPAFSQGVLLTGGVLLLLFGAALLLLGVMPRYFLAGYLLCEGFPVKTACRASRELTRGRVGEILYLFFSFVPWWLSCLLVLPAFYVYPRWHMKKAALAHLLLCRAAFTYDPFSILSISPALKQTYQFCKHNRSLTVSGTIHECTFDKCFFH